MGLRAGLASERETDVKRSRDRSSEILTGRDERAEKETGRMRFCELLKNVFHAGLGMVNDQEIVDAAVEVFEHFVLTETALKGKDEKVSGRANTFVAYMLVDPCEQGWHDGPLLTVQFCA